MLAFHICILLYMRANISGFEGVQALGLWYLGPITIVEGGGHR
jgi:hypothetical protein